VVLPGGDGEIVARKGGASSPNLNSGAVTKQTTTVAMSCWKTSSKAAAVGSARLTVIEQHLWSPLPMSQFPAIFLQHSISAGVIDEFGKQAKDGKAASKQTRKNPIAERKLTPLSYLSAR